MACVKWLQTKSYSHGFCNESQRNNKYFNNKLSMYRMHKRVGQNFIGHCGWDLDANVSVHREHRRSNKIFSIYDVVLPACLLCCHVGKNFFFCVSFCLDFLPRSEKKIFCYDKLNCSIQDKNITYWCSWQSCSKHTFFAVPRMHHVEVCDEASHREQ